MPPTGETGPDGTGSRMAADPTIPTAPATPTSGLRSRRLPRTGRLHRSGTVLAAESLPRSGRQSPCRDALRTRQDRQDPTRTRTRCGRAEDDPGAQGRTGPGPGSRSGADPGRRYPTGRTASPLQSRATRPYPTGRDAPRTADSTAPALFPRPGIPCGGRPADARGTGGRLPARRTLYHPVPPPARLPAPDSRPWRPGPRAPGHRAGAVPGAPPPGGDRLPSGR